MKVLLAHNSKEFRSDCINFVKNKTEENLDPGLEIYETNYMDLSPCYLGSIDELIIPSLIEYLPNEDISNLFKKWIEYTSIGGTITIGGVELLEVCHALSAGEINENDVNKLLYPKLGCYSLKQVIEQFKDDTITEKLEITKQIINGLHYLVEARRIQ